MASELEEVKAKILKVESEIADVKAEIPVLVTEIATIKSKLRGELPLEEWESVEYLKTSLPNKEALLVVKEKNLAELRAEKNRLESQQSQAREAGQVVIFKLLMPWTPNDFQSEIGYIQRAKKFPTALTFDMITPACLELFPDYVNNATLWVNFKLFGVKDDMEFEIERDYFAFESGCHIRIVPRYFITKFHIVTLAIAYSRLEVQKQCKVFQIAGSVTRDNINSLFVEMCHPNYETLHEAYNNLKKWVSENGGYIDETNLVQTFGFGTLRPVVIAHRGTAKRNDGIDSWEDEDAKSGSTYFNAPAPAIKPKSTSSTSSMASTTSTSSMASRLANYSKAK